MSPNGQPHGQGHTDATSRRSSPTATRAMLSRVSSRWELCIVAAPRRRRGQAARAGAERFSDVDEVVTKDWIFLFSILRS
jgi:hypothetical protein